MNITFTSIKWCGKQNESILIDTAIWTWTGKVEVLQTQIKSNLKQEI